MVGTSKKIDQTLQPKKRITDLGNLIFSIIGFALISLGIIALVSLLYSFVSDANTIGINSILEMIQENLLLQESRDTIELVEVFLFQSIELVAS